MPELPLFDGLRLRLSRAALPAAVALGIGVLAASAAQAQGSGADKPLPAKSRQTAFYTPEGQQEIADAILTDALDQLWTQADAHFHKGEYNHFINLSRIIVQGNPRNVEAFSDAAYLLWSTGQNDAATRFLKQGVAANQDSYYMYDELAAHYYYRLKEYSNALPYYVKAVKFDCPFFTWAGLAHTYEKLDQWENAVGAWEKAANFVTRGGEGGARSPQQMQADRSIGDTMKRNLARARRELARRRKP